MLHKKNEVIAERYRIITILGRSSWVNTYEAFDLVNSQPVAIKAISQRQRNRQVDDLKVLELFERDAKVLASIDHPCIPDYLDYFELGTESDRSCYLIEELVVGKSLKELVTNGWHPSETEVKDIAIQLLNILTYLHSRSPAIIHQNIKPQNIILCQDKQIYLFDVDFGSVKNYCLRKARKSFGVILSPDDIFMSPEYYGGFVPASDLYSLGFCLLFLLSRKPLWELPRTTFYRFDLRSQIDVSPSFQAWLSKIIEPKVEYRFDSATAAIEALKNKSTIISLIKSAINKLKPAKIIVSQQPNCLRYTIPLGSYYPQKNQKPFSNAGKMVKIIASVFTLEAKVIRCAWLLYLGLKKRLLASLPNAPKRYLALEINAQTFCLERTIGIDNAGLVKIDRQSGKTADISRVDHLQRKKDYTSARQVASPSKYSTNCLIITTGKDYKSYRRYAFGDEHLTQTEITKMIYQIEKFIESLS